jgi:hypothetical protein
MERYAHTSEGSSKQVHVNFCRRCGTTIGLTFERWPDLTALSRGSFDEPNSVSIGSHIWTSSAQTGVVLPAKTDCFRFARFNLAGGPENPERFDTPQMARTSSA